MQAAVHRVQAAEPDPEVLAGVEVDAAGVALSDLAGLLLSADDEVDEAGEEAVDVERLSVL